VHFWQNIWPQSRKAGGRVCGFPCGPPLECASEAPEPSPQLRSIAIRFWLVQVRLFVPVLFACYKKENDRTHPAPGMMVPKGWLSLYETIPDALQPCLAIAETFPSYRPSVLHNVSKKLPYYNKQIIIMAQNR